ncbi:hypothetical protein ASPWEDRAFT_170549 [Aspergillus wentii DTO 134E9]|uniref:Cytochrome P450 n=1 Tax=Aspergillus wentii DTO 134E9 TaxID=1073089 RepID=A0A1L9RQ48_ASPWE|nr:uncharacterized protein ASPWEDRAFT_170549 [Aspergillus wentii DTO 134E9]KAI9928453.1 hypothetical protein MW887_002498 [Aspergillus wentii]OJJ37054.1 hypothetical protein ASPWEDRAFT_170549 [Aspergillus wentii DTO 134E9]
MLSIIVALVVILTLYKYITYLHSPLSKIPNAHFTSPFTSKWIDSKRNKGTEVLTLHSLHRKHGPLVRLAPNELSVNSLHGLKTIYTGAFEKHCFYADVFVNFMTPNLVGMVHNKPHAEQKRMLSRVYSKSYLAESVDLRAISRMMLKERIFPILDNLAQTGDSVNVLPLFQAVGMDFTSSYLFGTENGTMFVFDMGEWMRWLGEYERFKYMSLQERYHGFIESWCLSLCQKMKLNEHPNDVSVSTKAVVYSQLHDSLLKNPDDRPIELAIASELLDHLVAGHETTGITFTYMMWQLSQHPHLQDELREELLTLQPQLKYPFTNDLPSPSSIDSLPLLDAMVRETLRLHSPAPGPLPRVTPHTPSGTSIDSYHNIPGGVKVSSSAYSLHRIEEVYPNPAEWLPERWLHPEGRIHDMRRLWWPFGSGGRMCLGSNFALQEIKLVMAAVFTNYTTTIVDDEGIEQDYEFISLPKGRKLMLRFAAVDYDS